jgi:hypothetical protein
MKPMHETAFFGLLPIPPKIEASRAGLEPPVWCDQCASIAVASFVDAADMTTPALSDPQTDWQRRLYRARLSIRTRSCRRCYDASSPSIHPVLVARHFDVGHGVTKPWRITSKTARSMAGPASTTSGDFRSSFVDGEGRRWRWVIDNRMRDCGNLDYERHIIMHASSMSNSAGCSLTLVSAWPRPRRRRLKPALCFNR